MQRLVTLEVVDGAGSALGSFACAVDTPWLQEVADVLARARAAGLDLSVLRLLSHASDPAGWRCTYLAEARVAPPPGVLGPAGQWQDDAPPHRLPYARLGGNARHVAWADRQLQLRALARAGAPEQQRTWNLSCVHRLPLADGGWAWLKAVPPFFRQEGAVIECVQALQVRAGHRSAPDLPRVLGHDEEEGLLLLAHADGPLMWGCGLEAWRTVLEGHVARQWALRGALPELLACGVPDRRGPALLEACRRLVSRTDVLATLAAPERAALQRLVDGLPGRLAAIEGCGLPDTLVHGDLHPGNVIATPSGPVLLDWGDAVIGHPLLDVPALCHGFPDAQQPVVRAQVAAAWRARLPAADVEAALALMAPVMALRQALVYQGFIDGIEPGEWHYHASDVPAWLRTALAAAAHEAGPPR